MVHYNGSERQKEKNKRKLVSLSTAIFKVNPREKRFSEIAVNKFKYCKRFGAIVERIFFL